MIAQLDQAIPKSPVCFANFGMRIFIYSLEKMVALLLLNYLTNNKKKERTVVSI